MKFEAEAGFSLLWIFPVHFHDAFYTFGELFYSHKIILLLHDLQKLRQLLKKQ